jgi:cobalt/nickel transport system permease protein
MEIISEFIKKDNWLAKSDARLKLLVTLSILVMILSNKGSVFPLIIFAISILLSIKIKVPLKVFMLRFSEPLFIALVLVVIKFFCSGSDILFSHSIFGLIITGHLDGLQEGLLIASRILGAAAVVSILGFSTAFTELLSALSWIKMPKTFIELLMFAYRYLFVLHEDAHVIYNAQKNRLGYASLRSGLSSFGTLAGSLVIKTFEHSQNITQAMTQRGYDGNLPVLKFKPFKPMEIVTSTLTVIILGLLWQV